MAKHIRVGDCFRIPLPDGRYAYGQYLCPNNQMGMLVQIFDIICHRDILLEDLRSAQKMFPPVFTSLKGAVKGGFWQVFGHSPVEDFKFPKFRSTLQIWAHKEGTFHDWKLWDGVNYTFIGDLPPQYQSLEMLIVWGSDLLEQRIATGINPYDSFL